MDRILFVVACVLLVVLICFGLILGTSPGDELVTPTKETPEYVRANEKCEAYVGPEFGDAPNSFPRLIAKSVVSGLSQPTDVVFIDTHTAIIGQREGLVLAWDLDSGRVRPAISGLVRNTSTTSDQGLIGLAIHPSGSHLYVHHTRGNGDNEVIAYPLRDGLPIESEGKQVLVVEQLHAMHNGGSMAFDSQGDFWISVGDGGLLGNPFHTGQDPTTLLGGIARYQVDANDPTLMQPHPDNPFYGSNKGDDALFAYGLRNPFRFSIDTQTDELWLGDVGQQCVEEVDVLTADDGGANLGWNVFEGNRPFLGRIVGEHHTPAFTYERGSGYCAVVGGLVYRGGQLEGAEGHYLFGDLCRGKVLALAQDNSTGWNTTAEIPQLVSLRTAPDGRLFGVSIEGAIYEVLLSP